MVLWWWLCCDTVTLSSWLVLCWWWCCCYCARQRLLIYYLLWLVITISPLNHSCLGVGVLLDHPLVRQLPSHHYLPVLAVPLPITRQRILFCLLIHHSIPIRNKVGILSHYPSWHASSGSNSSFPLFSGMLLQQDISLKRVWAGTPK